MTTIFQREILTSMNRGAVIRLEHVRKGSSVVRTFRMSDSQRRVPEETVRRLLADSLIKPNADGLLGNDGPPQSFSLYRASEGGA